MKTNPKIIFFGTSPYAATVLEALVDAGFIPTRVVTTPDKPAGKHLELKPSYVKNLFFSEEKLNSNSTLLQPEKLDTTFIETITKENFDLGIVVAYGKIIPQAVIDIPKHGILNVHASLLPKLRGASPIETAILEDEKDTGVTIIKIDSELDHGPIVAVQKIIVEPWPPIATELGEKIVAAGAQLLIKILPDYVEDKIILKEQDHSQATFTKKINKQDGLIDLSKDPYENFRKIQAYNSWPTAYFFAEKNGKQIRIIIKKASFNDGILTIERIIPEGKREQNYTEFLNSLKS